jgi:hypothetical protein
VTQVAPSHLCSGATLAELRPLPTGRSESQVAALVKSPVALEPWLSGFFTSAMNTYIELVNRYQKGRHVILIAWLFLSPPPPITKAEMDAH